MLHTSNSKILCGMSLAPFWFWSLHVMSFRLTLINIGQKIQLSRSWHRILHLSWSSLILYKTKKQDVFSLLKMGRSIVSCLQQSRIRRARSRILFLFPTPKQSTTPCLQWPSFRRKRRTLFLFPTPRQSIVACLQRSSIIHLHLSSVTTWVSDILLGIQSSRNWACKVGTHFVGHYFVRQSGLLHVEYEDEIVDFFTKAQPTLWFLFLVRKLILFDPSWV